MARDGNVHFGAGMYLLYLHCYDWFDTIDIYVF